MTPVVEKKTLDVINRDLFVNLGLNLLQGKYNFAISRKVNMGKAKGGSIPDSVGPPIDKIIQKALALVLETIFEPKFLDNSLGFRPKRGVHMALEELFLKGGNYS